MNFKISYFIIIISFFFTSCLSYKELINFRSGDEKAPTLSHLQKQGILNRVDIKLQTNDVLAVIIASPDVVLAAPYNIVSSQMINQTIPANSPTTYLINSEGFIDLPTLGEIKAEGLTIKELKQEILKRVTKDLKNASVNVRLINFKISVLGEIGHPGEILITDDRINILQALAKAGDFTPYSDRRHVMVIRDKNGVREVGELNLKDTAFFSSPYFSLQQDDIIYIEPTKGKIAQIQQPVNTYLQPVQVGISILAILIALFKK